MEYDTSLFGAPRRIATSRKVHQPSYQEAPAGLLYMNEKGVILGYNLVRQVICEAGAKIGLTMAPLYADDDIV